MKLYFNNKLLHLNHESTIKKDIHIYIDIDVITLYYYHHYIIDI